MPALAMPLADPTDEEGRRLAALERYDILDTPEESGFNRIADLVKRIFNVETALVTFLDSHRQWYKAAAGNNEAGVEVALPDSFCQYTLRDETPLVVPDATLDPRFSSNPHVTGAPYVRFYAGIPLRTPDGFHIGTICAIDSKPHAFSDNETAIFSSLAQMAMSELELRQLASVDALTGIASRRMFKEEAGRLVALARRHRTRLTAIGFDIDNFKTINDTYGHAMGDKALSAVARAVSAQMRKSDVFGRLGGDEFVIVMPDADAASAYAIAEKLRIAIRALKFANAHPPLSVSASFGVALLDPGTDDLEALITKTDEALYEAKRKGRNRSVLWSGAQATASKPIERRRVLKAARVIFNNKLSAVDCTVRAIWDTGAELMVSTTVGIPDTLSLEMKSDGFSWAAEVSNRKPTSLELRFL